MGISGCSFLLIISDASLKHERSKNVEEADSKDR